MKVKPGYKQTEVGVIPVEWDVLTFSDVFNVTAGGDVDPKRSKPYQDEIHCYPIYSNALTNYGLYGYCSYADHPAGSITITARGMIGGANFRDHPYTAIGRVLVLQPKREIAGRFFDEVINTRVKFAIESTGVPQLTAPQISTYRLPVPSLPEQRAIAGALSEVDALIGALERLIAKKRDLKAAAMQQLLTGQTRLPGFNGEWEEKTLGDVITHCFSGATPRRNRPDFYKGDIRWITSGELKYKLITDTAEKITTEAVARTNLSIIPTGTFLMAITGLEAEGTRGSCGIVGAPSTTNQSCMAIFPTRDLMTPFLFHYYVFRGDSLALQYCQGTKQQSYTAKLVKRLPIDLPPTTAEQTAIAAVLSDMDTELAALEQRREKSRAIKQGMMQELLTGRTRLL